MAIAVIEVFPCKILFQRLSSEGHTRSHPEHGSQASDRRWYLVLGSGRVGRRWILEAPCRHGGGPLRFCAARRFHESRWSSRESRGALSYRTCSVIPLTWPDLFASDIETCKHVSASLGSVVIPAPERESPARAGLVQGRHRLTHLVTDLSNQFSMLFVFLCSRTGRAGNRTVMRTCNICTLNIPTWHIDKKSIKIAKKYVPRACSNCSLRM